MDGGCMGAPGRGAALSVAKLYDVLNAGLGRWITPTETVDCLSHSAAPEMNPGAGRALELSRAMLKSQPPLGPGQLPVSSCRRENESPNQN